MKQTIRVSHVCDFMKRQLVDVFNTMLAMQAVPVSAGALPGHAERVTGSIGFGGDNVNGVLYLHVSDGFANRMAAAMLRLPPEQTAREGEVNDVIGEVGNMLAGGLKSWLSDSGVPCAVSTPAIIRGTSYAIAPAPDIDHAWQVFDCGGEHVALEIHIKLE